MESNAIPKSILLLMFFILVASYTKLLGQIDSQQNVDGLLNTDTISQFYVNPDILTEQEKGLFIKILTNYSIEKNFYDTVKIRRSQTVSSIIKLNNNFSESKNYYSTDILKQKIREINNLDDDYSILFGDSLNIPKIPINPVQGNSKSYTQVFNILEHTSYISSTEAIINFNEDKTIANVSQRRAGLWMYYIPKSDLKKILDSIPIDIQKKLYGTAYIVANEEPEFAEVGFPLSYNSGDQINEKLYLPSSLKDKLSSLRSSDFRAYYIVDFFDKDNCTHGKKVLAVAYQRLKEYGLDSLKINIIPIPINFFDNEQFAISFLKEYYSSNWLSYLQKLEGEVMIAALQKIKDKKIKKCEYCIPEIYLESILKHYYVLSPDIISTSFYINTHRNIMPNFVRSPTTLITASLNEPGRKIEDLQYGNSKKTIQPLYSSWINAIKFGTIIVGCQIKPNVFYGMYSETGDGISTLGKGTGWGENQDCLHTTEIGSSFATPDVGIKLLIAKAYWRSKNRISYTDASEARTRLILCSDIDSSFIGKFASGGQPSMSKLLVISEGFVENQEGDIIDCVISDSSFIEYDQNLKSPIMRGSKGISGITIIGDSVYAFFESSFSWKQININKMLLIIVINGNNETYTSIDQLRSKYKQIVKLKT